LKKNTLIILYILLFSSKNATAVEIQRVNLVPAADGEISDSSGTGIFDKVSSTINDSNELYEIKIGELSGENKKGIFEFFLPEKLNKKIIISAELYLSLNGTYGTYPDKPGAGPEFAIYYYVTENANENVSKEDNSGGNLIENATNNNKVINNNHLTINITKTLISALNMPKVNTIGFRIEKTPRAPKNVSWRILSSEFGQKFGNTFIPHILIKSK